MAVSQLARVIGEEASLEKLLERIADRSARIGVIGERRSATGIVVRL
jgi:hypothetical protein